MPTTRRRFIALTAASLAFANRYVAGAATPPPAKSLLGFSLYGMKTLPLERALAECARIGYRTVELSLIPGFPTEPSKLTSPRRREIRDQIKAAGLPVASLLVNLSLTGDDKEHAAHLETLEKAAGFAAEIDPSRPPIVQTVMGGKPAEWEAKKAMIVARLKIWDTIARRHGVTVAVKAHVSSAVDTPAKLLWAFTEAGGTNLALAYDYSHFALAGLSLEESLRPLAPHIKFVHVKDARRDGTDIRFLLPGEGDTAYRAYFRALRTFGYHGPLVVEVSSQIFNRPGYDPIATAEKCYAVLTRALEK